MKREILRQKKSNETEKRTGMGDALFANSFLLLLSNYSTVKTTYRQTYSA